VITLSNATGALRVKIGSDALSESSALKRKARAHKLRRLVLTVIAANATGKRTTVPVPLNHRGS
jgi:hypothetical protein